MLRLALAETATQNLDLQYYYWKHDLTGRLLTRAVLLAADRGVKVRLLLDDMNAFGFDRTNITLDSHPNIEVRLFNPSRSRIGKLRRWVELGLKYVTATRRMHNKNWITDNKLAIVGGRNIGDAYFDASTEANFRDTDVLLEGAVVEQATATFDDYWNSRSAVPIRNLRRLRRPNSAKLRATLDANASSPQVQKLLEVGAAHTLSKVRSRATRFSDSNQIYVAADPPEKAESRNSSEWLHHKIRASMAEATSQLRLTSPYFIPGQAGVADLSQLVDKGVSVKIITNSLAATDVAAVHGAYANYRLPLLAKGIELFELKAQGRKTRTSVFGSRTASLHTKSFVVDEKTCFVGSFNLDPRSVSINTEMGIFMSNSIIASQLAKIFERQSTTSLSYRLGFEDHMLHWLDHTGEKIRTPEPGASLSRRLIAKLVSWLPIETQL
jgi:cardiolipin synthase C